MEEENDRIWHIDKRVSIGHLVTTITVIMALVAWSFQIQSRIDKNEIRITAVELAIRELRNQNTLQYTEIIRRLERIDTKIDTHLAEHSRENR